MTTPDTPPPPVPPGQTCNLPLPVGRCIRRFGHDGPCDHQPPITLSDAVKEWRAAAPVPPGIEEAALYLEILALHQQGQAEALLNRVRTALSAQSAAHAAQVQEWRSRTLEAEKRHRDEMDLHDTMEARLYAAHAAQVGAIREAVAKVERYTIENPGAPLYCVAERIRQALLPLPLPDAEAALRKVREEAVREGLWNPCTNHTNPERWLAERLNALEGRG